MYPAAFEYSAPQSLDEALAALAGLRVISPAAKLLWKVQSCSRRAYEPIFAIGTGTPDTPENAEKVCEEIMNKNSNYSVLYGGSVSSENIASFTKKEAISGVLVGGASLNPQEFIKIINNA